MDELELRRFKIAIDIPKKEQYYCIIYPYIHFLLIILSSVVDSTAENAIAKHSIVDLAVLQLHSSSPAQLRVREASSCAKRLFVVDHYPYSVRPIASQNPVVEKVIVQLHDTYRYITNSLTD